jgi:predicted component of type VI protein secretion system
VGEACPDCGAARTADGGNFCEVCGYNFVTGAHGEVPVADPPAAAPVPPEADPIPEPAAPASRLAPPAGWAVLINVDPSLRDAGSPEPPADFAPVTIDLDKPVSMIGRKSPSRAIFPEIALDLDAAVSHRHAILQRGDDGTLVLRDIGSSNGTRLNGKDVEPMTDKPLQDGDQITLGHWTRITVKAVR